MLCSQREVGEKMSQKEQTQNFAIILVAWMTITFLAAWLLMILLDSFDASVSYWQTVGSIVVARLIYLLVFTKATP